MGDDIVTVLVGPREKRYSVHKALLTTGSEYFARALNGKFKEADEQTIRLQEESPDAFDLLIGWLYQNQIPVLGYFSGPFNDFPKGLVVGATKLGKALPPNNGTGSVAYQPHEEQSSALFAQQPANNNWVDRFHHICTQPEYELYSSEELRLEDYSRKRGNSALLGLEERFGLSCSFPASTGHIKGIPYCSPIEPIMAAEEAHQLSLIRLCLFAETICWTSLFNVAMCTYMQGENFLSPRPMPTEHIELIYQRAHEESPCRKFAADSAISQIGADGQIDRTMDIVEHCPFFLEDILKRIRRNRKLTQAHKPNVMGSCEYHVHEENKKPDRCSAESTVLHFIMNGTVPRQQEFVVNRHTLRHFSGDNTENTEVGSGLMNENATPGSTDEVRYTTYRPGIGYTTRTLGYNEPITGTSSSSPFSFGRPSDGMDWRGAPQGLFSSTDTVSTAGSRFDQGLFAANIRTTPMPNLGFAGFGSSNPPSFHPTVQPTRPAFATAGSVAAPLFDTNTQFGSGAFHQSNIPNSAVPTSSNPARTTASSPSSLNSGTGSTSASIPIPVSTATAPRPESSNHPQVPVSVSMAPKSGSPAVPTLSDTTTNLQPNLPETEGARPPFVGSTFNMDLVPTTNEPQTSSGTTSDWLSTEKTDSTVQRSLTTSLNTSTSTTARTVTASMGDIIEAKSSNATPKKDAVDVSDSRNPGINASKNVKKTVFGEVSPLISSLPPLTSGTNGTSGIFGQRCPSGSTTSNPSASFSSSATAAMSTPSGGGSFGFSPLPPFSAPSTEASNAFSFNTTSASPFSFLGPRSPPLFNNQTTASPSNVSPAPWTTYRSPTVTDENEPSAST